LRFLFKLLKSGKPMNYTIKNKLPSQLSLAPLTDVGGKLIRLQPAGKKGSSAEVNEATRDNAILKRVEGLQWVEVNVISPVVAVKAPAPKAAPVAPVAPAAPAAIKAPPVKVTKAPAVSIKASAPEAELVNPVVQVEEAVSVKTTTEVTKLAEPSDK
jgi:hypothetical protein